METLKQNWLDFFQSDRKEDNWWERKRGLYRDRKAEMVRISGEGHLFEKLRCSGQTTFRYLLHLSFLIKQHDLFFKEEQVMPFQFRLENGKLVEHKVMERPFQTEEIAGIEAESLRGLTEKRFSYDRRSAVQYAERWWNSYNPSYRKFDVDCTNYVSQCMRAGGAPMRGAPDRGSGWWYQDETWSYSWAVAHSLRWYLSGSTSGLKGKEMESARDLIPGDVICYDFEGDGKWDHNTIVVAKDADGMPLVNAHTDNSRNRYWSYEDSTAWTPEIGYKFFRIGE
ncbi:Putative amidase domain-containing protein [Lentibacillus halodurans]|uniref:Putative amidase domain-containing protein n=1 Tax=Lentibacillus halodurans TaxID=237679 RepID=A0A1I0VVW9_9BACI|nr:amidase domain-containing protein [Lentibacillus halodurans]SFA80531.1 Putative amidase domain-containing protein [Lentibacillus halodurans]